MTPDPGHMAAPVVQAGSVDTGLTLAIQTVLSQQAQITADVSAMRADVSKALTRLEVIDQRNKNADDFHRDIEARIRVLEARPGVPVDHEPRIRALEKWRYALPASVGFGLASILVTVLGYFHH